MSLFLLAFFSQLLFVYPFFLVKTWLLPLLSACGERRARTQIHTRAGLRRTRKGAAWARGAPVLVTVPLCEARGTRVPGSAACVPCVLGSAVCDSTLCCSVD